ncbi:MAG: restriction endonuclease subunit S [Mesotoga sp.]
MRGEWQTKSIEEIAAPEPRALAMGPFGSNIKTDNFVPEGVPIIRGQNLNAERFNDSGFVYLTEKKADELAASNAFSGDLVFTHRGTLGQVGIIPSHSKYDRYIVSQSQMKLKCDRSKVEPLFIFYFFRAPQGQNELLSNASTTGVPAISRPLTTLKSIRLPIPPLPEQRAIAHILGSLDDKIELNRRMNQTLQAMARAIFKHWFIDFEFPNENGEPYKSSGGETINSPLGPIPKGWRIGRIEDVCEFSYGKALKADKRIQGRIPVYGSNGQIGWHNESLVSGPGIIVGRKGNPGLIHWSKEDFFPIDTTFYVVPRVGKSIMHFLYFALKHVDLPRLSADSAVPGLNRNIAYMQQLVIPTEQLLRDFENRISIIFDLLQTNCWQNQSLSELRDSLLPKLVSGEIRVPVSEKEDDQL